MELVQVTVLVLLRVMGNAGEKMPPAAVRSLPCKLKNKNQILAWFCSVLWALHHKQELERGCREI